MDCAMCGTEVYDCPICGTDEPDHDTTKCFQRNELRQFATAERIRRTQNET